MGDSRERCHRGKLPAIYDLNFEPFSSSGLVAYVDLDERAIDALREFNEEGALTVLQQFKESDLSHVQVSVC